MYIKKNVFTYIKNMPVDETKRIGLIAGIFFGIIAFFMGFFPWVATGVVKDDKFDIGKKLLNWKLLYMLPGIGIIAFFAYHLGNLSQEDKKKIDSTTK
jgi:hypothetical protein